MAQMIILVSVKICLVSYVVTLAHGNNLNSELSQLFCRRTLIVLILLFQPSLHLSNAKNIKYTHLSTVL